jgi:hypothetical protein
LLTLSFAILVAGNIMDNATGQERKMMVVIDICMGLSLLFWALAFKLVKYHSKNDKKPLSEEIEIYE